MKKYINEELIKIIISLTLFIISLFVEGIIPKFAFIAISYSIISTRVYLDGITNIKKKKFFDENILMVIATIAAFAIGSFNEAVMVILLFEIGEYLSDLAVNKSKKSIIKLLDLRTPTANLLRNDEVITVDIKKIKTDDIIIVKPGEKIPLDGIVIEGTSYLDTSSLTGETKPKGVKENDLVLSGCINKEEVLKIKATTTYKNSTTAKIIDLLEKYNNKKANTEKFITKFAKIYTPIIVILAFIIAFIPILINQPITTWLYRALVFLVTACPCALVISIPLTYFCGIGKASKEGILIKGSKELELLSQLDYIIFDKTGTITEGVFEVTKVYPIGVKEEKLLQLVASAEEYSTHPIATAIKNKNELKKLNVDKYKEISGKGITCEIKNKKIIIGNEQLLKENKVMVLPVSEKNTIVHVAVDNEYVGYIVISDKMKKTSSKIKTFKNLIKKDLIILSGDVEDSVKVVAKKVGITKYESSMLPQDKVEYVEKLKKQNKVLFVGDGINDAPVLKISDVGVSMGQIGTDAAIEASDIVIMKDDLMKIKTSILIAKEIKKKTIENIVFVLGIKTLVLALAVMGISTIWMAVFADVGVTLISILNTLTIMWKKFD